MDQGELLIGRSREGPVRLPLDVLKRHVTVLGASGSGKTVMAKCFIEEATLAGIPSVLIDPQGDLASMALGGLMKDIEDHGGDPTRLVSLTQKAEVRIFTPASSKGIPISIDPLHLPPPDRLSPDERVRAVDMVAKGLTQLLGYDVQSDDGKSCTAFLYQLIEQLWESGVQTKDFARFAEIVADPEGEGLEGAETFISPRERATIAKKLRQFSVGLKKLMFNFGAPLDMATFLSPANASKVPINIIYLNTLNAESDKQFFVSMVAREIYNWMLQNPSERVQLVFYIDEVSSYLPPHPRNPPAKEMLTLLFKQGRKYGVSCLMCTQNPADIDYKAMAQANTWALGRMMTKQDLSKVSHMVKSMAPEEVESIMTSIPNLSTGHFLLICPDVFKRAKPMQARWLLTQHTTLDEDGLRALMPAAVRDHFARFQKGAKAKEWVNEQRERERAGESGGAGEIKQTQGSADAKTEATSEGVTEVSLKHDGPAIEDGAGSGVRSDGEVEPVRARALLEEADELLIEAETVIGEPVEPEAPDEATAAHEPSASPGSVSPGVRQEATTPAGSPLGGIMDAVSHLPGLWRKEEATAHRPEPPRPPGDAKDHVLVPRLNVSQAAVTHLAEKERESTLFIIKGETVGDIRLFYLPIYHVEYQIQTKRLGLMRTEHKGSLTFHGQTGQILMIETEVMPPFKAKELAFTTNVDQHPWDYKDLTGFREFAQEYVHRNDLVPRDGKGNEHTLTKVKLRNLFKRLFGEPPTEITPSYLPVWELNLMDKKIVNAARKVFIDGVLGKELELM